METLRYTIIKSKNQYNNYCNILESLVDQDDTSLNDEIELLSLLIEKWDTAHNSFDNLNPIEMIKALMVENNLKSKDLVHILDLTKGTVSKILSYHKGLSKNTIRVLSVHFKISQEAFNRPYNLIIPVKRFDRNTNVLNT